MDRVVESLVRLGRWRDQLKKGMETHQDLLLLLALFLSLRLSLLVISQPQGYLLGFSDYDYYLDLARMSDRGMYPMLQYWTEYPPVFPWMAVAAYRLTEVIPTLNGSPIFWFRLALGSFTLLFDTGNLVLVYLLGRSLYDAARGLRVAWCYALLFAPLHVWLAWFDTVPLFFLLLSVTLTVRGRRSAAALAAGLGFMVKVFPILALPLLLKAERRVSNRISLVAEAALGTLLVAAPFLLAAPQYLVASFRSMFSRTPWETVWALRENYFGYGEVAALSDRTDPATATFTNYPTHLPWLTITVVFAALYLLLWTRPFDTSRGRNAVAFAGLTVNLFLLYSKGYSPQFLVYVVPFALLTLAPLRAFAYLVVLSAINLLEYPTYGVLIPNEHWLLSDLVLLRTLVLLLLCWEYLVVLEIVPSLDRLRRAVPAATVLGFALWAAFSLPTAAEAWSQASLARSPNATLVSYLLANAGHDSAVLFTDQALYRELYPYLYAQTNLYLVDPTAEERVASGLGLGRPAQRPAQDVPALLAQLSLRYQHILNVRRLDDMQGRQLEQTLRANGRLEAANLVQELTVSRWTTHP